MDHHSRIFIWRDASDLGRLKGTFGEFMRFPEKTINCMTPWGSHLPELSRHKFSPVPASVITQTLWNCLKDGKISYLEYYRFGCGGLTEHPDYVAMVSGRNIDDGRKKKESSYDYGPKERTIVDLPPTSSRSRSIRSSSLFFSPQSPTTLAANMRYSHFLVVVLSIAIPYLLAGAVPPPPPNIRYLAAAGSSAFIERDKALI
ncbi:hypothetical protein LQW54_010671 [Pestalotiopsis sp. IQ-011]